MRTLTEAFAPGAPSLPEGLRTLVVSPDRVVEPGTTVRATFSFYNLGGAAATGLRVRFALPDGLRYLVGSAKIDDVFLEEARGETALLAPVGADIGEVPPGVERRISISYLVNATIENGAAIEVQAALASHETDVIGSNVVRLVAHSAPMLQNPATIASLEPVRNAEPGEEIVVTARVYNSGQSSARDVVVVLPLPDRTSYVAGSARIDGRAVAPRDDRDDPFGYGRAPVAAALLAAGGTLVVEYRAKIESPLDNNTRLGVLATVASAEIAEFDLARAELTVNSASRFDGVETTLAVDAPKDVEPGRRVRVAFVATNNGTCAATDVRIRFTLPDGLQYAPGSRAVDGRSVGESEAAGMFAFERLDAAARVEAAIDAYVVSPAIDGTQLPITASLQWATGSRTFDRTLVIRSIARFHASRNVFALDGPTLVAPGADARFIVRVVNDGTAAATNTRLTVDADQAMQSLRYIDGDLEARVQGGTISLGAIEAGAEREIVVLGTVASPIGDRTEIRTTATLIANETTPLALGTIALIARSRPRFTPSGSHLTYAGEGAMRPAGSAAVVIALVNEGTDVARDARIALEISPEARIEAVEGATRDGNAIIFGDIAAGARVEATLRLRLARFVARGATVAVQARLSGAGILAVALAPVTIETLSEPDFADGASLRTQPRESVDAGEAIYVQLVTRNSGDGAASRVTVRAVLPEHTAYLPGSTSINDVPLLDAGGGSVLWSKHGLVLEDVEPGVEVSVRFCAIVNTPLAAGTLVEAAADLAWDGGKTLTLASPAVRVRSTPAFGVRASGLPFSVAGVAPRTADVLREIAPPRPPVLPALTPPLLAAPPLPAPEPFVVIEQPAVIVVPPRPSVQPLPPAPAVASVAATSQPRLRLTFTREGLERTLAFLEQSEYPGLISHLFVLRTLFPDGIVGVNGDVQAKFIAERDALRGVIDRLFIKMRMPRYVLTAKDIEDRPARSALVDLVATLRTLNSGAIQEMPIETVAIEGALERERLISNLAVLESEPLGGPRPWLVLAELLGEVISWPGGASDALGIYRRDLIATFLNISALPIDEFHRVLTGSTNASLDAALGDVRSALRVALEATVAISDHV
jgi:uncharacterized repeat protein (TIGR01451 family)